MRATRFQITPLLTLLSSALCLVGCGGSSPSLPKQVVRKNGPTSSFERPLEFYFYIQADQDIFGETSDGRVTYQGEILFEELSKLGNQIPRGGRELGLHLYLDRGIDYIDHRPISSEQTTFCSDQPPRHHLLGETDSTQPQYFQSLIENTCYNDSEKIIVFFGHGEGYRAQRDYDYQPQVSAFHVGTLLRLIPKDFAQAVLFDSCRMASLEIATLLMGRSKWMLASQFDIPAEGFSYRSLLQQISNGVGTLDILKKIRSDSEARFKRLGMESPLVLAHLPTLETLLPAFNQSITHLVSESKATSYGDLRRALLRGALDPDLHLLFSKYNPEHVEPLQKVFDGSFGSFHFALPESLEKSDASFTLVERAAPSIFQSFVQTLTNWKLKGETE